MWKLGVQSGPKGKLKLWVKIVINKGKFMDVGHRSEACGQASPEDVFVLMVF